MTEADSRSLKAGDRVVWLDAGPENAIAGTVEAANWHGVQIHWDDEQWSQIDHGHPNMAYVSLGDVAPLNVASIAAPAGCPLHAAG